MLKTMYSYLADMPVFKQVAFSLTVSAAVVLPTFYALGLLSFGSDSKEETETRQLGIETALMSEYGQDSLEDSLNHVMRVKDITICEYYVDDTIYMSDCNSCSENQ